VSHLQSLSQLAALSKESEKGVKSKRRADSVKVKQASISCCHDRNRSTWQRIESKPLMMKVCVKDSQWKNFT